MPDHIAVKNTSQGLYGSSAGSGADMVKYEHTAYPQGTHNVYKHSKSICRNGQQLASGFRACHVIPPPGQINKMGQTHDMALNGCLNRCRWAKRGYWCHGVNVVPLKAPPDVSDHVTWDVKPTERWGANIPWGKGDCTFQCLDGNPEGSMLCYPLVYKTPADLDEIPVGDKFDTVLDDPHDDTFYSTMFLKTDAWKFDLPPSPPSKQFPMWRFGDKCVSCNDALHNANSSTALSIWKLAEKCEMCERPPTIPFEPPSPPPAPPCLASGCDDVAPPWAWKYNTCEQQLLQTPNCAARASGSLTDGYCALTCGVCTRCPPSSPPPAPPPLPPPCESYCVDVEPPKDWRLNTCAQWAEEYRNDVPASALDRRIQEVGYCKHRKHTRVTRAFQTRNSWAPKGRFTTALIACAQSRSIDSRNTTSHRVHVWRRPRDTRKKYPRWSLPRDVRDGGAGNSVRRLHSVHSVATTASGSAQTAVAIVAAAVPAQTAPASLCAAPTCAALVAQPPAWLAILWMQLGTAAAEDVEGSLEPENLHPDI